MGVNLESASMTTIDLAPSVKSIYDTYELILEGVEYFQDEDDGAPMRDISVEMPNGGRAFLIDFKGEDRNLAYVSFLEPHQKPGDEPEIIMIKSDGRLVRSDESEVVQEDVPESEHQEILKRLEEFWLAKIDSQRIAAEERALARTAEIETIGSMEPVSTDLAKKIFEQSDIDEETRELLRGNSLLPVAAQKLSESTTAFYSGVYNDKSQHGVVAYLKNNETITPAYYYLSGSQAVWRYLPAHTIRDSGSVWYNKGEDEQSLTLPVPMQKALADLTGSNFIQVYPPVADILPELLSPEVKRPAHVHHQDKVDMLDESWKKSDLRTVSDNLRWGGSGPEGMSIKTEEEHLAPDTSKILASWQQPHPVYGSVRVDLIPSVDDTLQYTYLSDEEKRSWIGGVDDITAPIRSSGIRQGWVNLGAAGAPANEYNSQAGIYGGEDIVGSYVDVYDKFLSKVPLIKEYVEMKEDA
jgi:hypothetical protein